MKQLVIIGASGHGKVVADIAKKNGYEQIVFLDDRDFLTHAGLIRLLASAVVLQTMIAIWLWLLETR